ncbi:hypothetical protein IDJ75_18015 [Mucilaginibacter rigui]|uniref:Uncharacterized protein n=1 Tax=Mucilaginibacter rigui TaxID=534635 RepID=A0ABR7X9H7_9SPHI|nr:hypothetical protein [Mucilaginibacter rigui]MBD1387189.1 hypothetical protein [Mucilaginibacter rigui]
MNQATAYVNFLQTPWCPFGTLTPATPAGQILFSNTLMNFLKDTAWFIKTTPCL